MRMGLLAFLARTTPALALAGCYTASTPPPAKVADPDVPLLAASDLRTLTANEKALLAKGFVATLKDPGSAQFQWAKVPKRLPESGFDYCAMVNAKNSYGGYIGAQPFIGMVMVNNGKIIGGVIAAVGDANPTYQQIIPDMCRKKGLDPYAISDG